MFPAPLLCFLRLFQHHSSAGQADELRRESLGIADLAAGVMQNRAQYLRTGAIGVVAAMKAQKS